MRELAFQYQLLIYFTERILNRSQENYSQTEYAANYYFFLSFMFLIAFDQVCPKWFNIYEINKYEFMPQASFFFFCNGFLFCRLLSGWYLLSCSLFSHQRFLLVPTANNLLSSLPQELLLPVWTGQSLDLGGLWFPLGLNC